MADDQGRGRRRPLDEEEPSTSRGNRDGPVSTLFFHILTI